MDCFIFDGMQYMLHGGNGGMGVGTCRGWAFFLGAFGNRRPSGTYLVLYGFS